MLRREARIYKRRSKYKEMLRNTLVGKVLPDKAKPGNCLHMTVILGYFLGGRFLGRQFLNCLYGNKCMIDSLEQQSPMSR